MRIVTAFALGGLLLSVALALVTYVLAERYLLQQRERSARRQTYVNARILRADLQQPDVDVNTALRALELPARTSAIVQLDNRWFSTSIGTSQASVPKSLRELVASGSAGRQRTTVDGTPTLVFGLPLPAAQTDYYELFILSELDSTLNVIRNALVGAAAVTTVAAALVGWWAARRVLRPVTDVSHAAEEIAGGELATRLDAHGDPDLAPLTESFNRMGLALEQRIARDARFVSDVSHELRSPLTTLATTAEMLEARRDTFDDRDRHMVDLLAADVRRFQRLVAELLELSRAESGTDELVTEPVNLAELVLQIAAASSIGPLAVDIEAGFPNAPVLTDKRRLERVLTNLLENAAIYGDGATAVELSSTGSRLRIDIVDAGPGIPEAERDRVFERFYRGAAAGQRGVGTGTGLGLALAAEHVRVLGGTIRIADGEGGHGTRLVVEIPMVPA